MQLQRTTARPKRLQCAANTLQAAAVCGRWANGSAAHGGDSELAHLKVNGVLLRTSLVSEGCRYIAVALVGTGS